VNNTFACLQSYFKKQYILSNTMAYFLTIFQSAKHFVENIWHFWIMHLLISNLVSRNNTSWKISSHISLHLISSNKIFRRKYLIFWIKHLLVSILFQETICFEKHYHLLVISQTGKHFHENICILNKAFTYFHLILRSNIFEKYHHIFLILFHSAKYMMRIFSIFE